MIESIITPLTNHQILISLIGPLFFGGATILILAILTGKGLLSVWPVLIFCPMGMIIADSIWFLAGRIKRLSKMKRYRIIRYSYDRAQREIEVAPSEKFLLILIKFTCGIAIPILMYLGRKKMTFREFLIKDSKIVLIWSSSIVIIGWLIGKTSEIAAARFENFYTFVMLVITSLIIAYLIVGEIKRRIFEAQYGKAY